MAISMQGAWTVSVRSKNAAFPQRFIISGATSGNGVYNGITATPPVFVTGASWAIRIQSDPGTGFVDSTEQITFPTVVGPNVQFDIQSNDVGGDQDFDDLILTCSTPQSATEFIIYGNVGTYSGNCIFNPCNFPWVVIDSLIGLNAALKNPVLRVPIEKLYRERIPIPRPPLPDPPPLFDPLVIPLQGTSALPPKLGQVVRIVQPAPQAPMAKGKEAGAAPAAETAVAVRSLSLSTPARARLDYDVVAVAGIFDRIRLFCNTMPLPGYGLRFQEYDRTAAELAGGPYTGTGTREDLGVCTTDRNGNYIFRFSRSIADFLNEAAVDTALGEDETVQAMPDIIGEVLDSTVPGGVAYQSAPFWNIGNLRRINLCVPSGSVRPPEGCQGGRPMQRIGNIRLTTPLTTFDADGRVTCTDNSLPDIPQARCAAWHGALRLFGCFLNANGTKGPVQWYTIQFRRRAGMGWSSWQFYQEELRLKQVGVILPVQTGPFDRSLDVPDVGIVTAKAYQNIELDGAWEASDWFVKAVLSSSIYAPTPNTVQFRIQGYNGTLGSGSREVGKTDTITLYIDNTIPDFGIQSVNMGSQTGGDCALFHESGEPVPARLTVEWKAVQNQGFLESYALTVRKGNIGNFQVVQDSGYAPIADTYSAPVGTCVNFTGTPGLVVTDIKPASGNWLGTESFCTFAVQVSAAMRVTNGTDGPVSSFGPAEYFLGIEK
jgi:hypothetical protein